MRQRYLQYAAIGLCVAILSTLSWAAQQGTAGMTSQGGAGINVSVDQTVRISDLQDLHLGSFTGATSDLIDEDDVCVYSNVDDNGSYQITASTATGAFNLSAGMLAVPFRLFWNNVSGSSAGEQELTYNQPLITNGANTAINNCGGSTTAHIRLLVEELFLRNALSGVYFNTIYLLIEPV